MKLKSSILRHEWKWNTLNTGILTLVLVILVNYLFGISSALYEIVYLKGIFQLIRILHDFTLGLIPIPSIYITVPAIVSYFVIYRFKGSWGIIKTLASFIIWAICLFYILWAFNYNQSPLRDKLNLTTSPIDSSYIVEAYLDQTQKLNSILNSLDSNRIKEIDQAHIREVQESILSSWSIPVIGRVNVRQIPAGSLLHFRTSGIYIPHAFEGHIDGGLYKVQHAFTLAHEMAHGYGITDESECNFIAYLTCTQSGVPEYVYSAELAYWRYLASYYRKWEPESWKDSYEDLHPLLREDLEEIRAHIVRYKDWMPKYRDIIYDNYLKQHGVKAGIRSYDQMVVLIKAYKESESLSKD